MVKPGYRQTSEHRAKIAAAARARFANPEQRELMRSIGVAKSHGMVGTPTYGSWAAMKRRAKNPTPRDVKHYGENGVGLDPRWESFEEFFADMGLRPDGHTLDRIDNDRGYWPDNCRWSTHRDQRLNQRRSAK